MLHSQGGLTSMMASPTLTSQHGETPNRQISLPLWNSERSQGGEDRGTNELQPQESLEDLAQLSSYQQDGGGGDKDDQDKKSPSSSTPKNSATLLSCTINLANTIVGAGLLGLPGAFGGTGWLGGSILLIAGAVFSTHGLYLLSKAAMQVGVYPSSFYTVAHAAVPRYTILIDLAVALKCFGVATGYLIIVGDSMVDALDHILLPNGLDDENDASMIVSWVLSRQFWIVGALLGVLPVSFFQSFDSLKHASAAALVFVFMLAIGIVAYAQDLADPCEGYENEYECRGSVVPYTDAKSTLEKLPIFIFSFTCHQNIFPVVSEIQNRTMARINIAIMSAIGFGFIMFWIVAIEGYMTYGSHVKGDILLNYPETGKVTVMRICIAFMLTLHYPLQLDPSRRCIMSLIKEVQNVLSSSSSSKNSKHMTVVTTTTQSEQQQQQRPPYDDSQIESSTLFANIRQSNSPHKDYNSSGTEMQQTQGKRTPLLDTANETILNDSVAKQSFETTKTPSALAESSKSSSSSVMFYVVTFGFLLFSFATALVVDDLGVVLAMVGATGSTLVSYVLPGLIYIKLHPSDKFDGTKIMAYVQLVLGCLIMPIALYFVLRGASVH